MKLNEVGKLLVLLLFAVFLAVIVNFLPKSRDKTNYKLNLLKTGKVEVTTETTIDTIELDSLVKYIENNEI